VITAADADEARDIERQLGALLGRAARLDQRLGSLQSIDACAALRTARDAMSVVTDQCEICVTPPIVVLHEAE
jgi:hypothetical protein